MARLDTIGTHRTTVREGNGRLSVVYVATEVVYADDTIVKLDTGGWFTTTTKTRMNQASRQFGLGYTVYQKRGSWFVDVNGTTLPFDGDTVQFDRAG